MADETPIAQQRSTQADWRPIPDPTSLTTDLVARGLAAERDFCVGQISILEERLRGMDRATEVLGETVNRVPTDLQDAISHVRELIDEKFQSVSKQFHERDTRSERESRDNKVAVDAAFAAQKEAAAKQDEANQKAIDKSERATAEQLTKLSELFKTTTDGLADKIEDVKNRQTAAELVINGINARTAGGREATSDKHEASAAIYALVGFVVSLILAAIIVVGVLAARK